METVQQAKNNYSALRAEGREIVYPAKCKSVNAKDKHKEKTLCGNPEVLFTDYAQQREGRKKNNLIFFTDSIYIWKDTLCSKYAHVSREGIGSGGRLKICKDEHLDKDDPLLTITYYTKGKVMVQGNEANLESFQEAFPLLKAEVDTKRINVPSDVPSGDESPIENPNTLSISAPPTPASSNNRLKESVALLELDFAEFKERTQARQSGPPDNTLQQLKEDLQQLKSHNEALASDLRGSVEALKQENSVLRVQLAKVREDAECREKSFTRQVQHLTEKLSSVLTMTSRETQTLPASVLGPPSLLSTQPNNTLAPPDTPTQPAAHSQLCPPQPPSTQPEEQDPQVVLLADSNGKFLDPRKLFPDEKVLSKHCSTTGQVLSKHCSTTGQVLSKHCSTTGQVLSKHCSTTGQVLSKHCSTTGQVLSKHCSTTGQAMKLLKKETLRSPQYLRPYRPSQTASSPSPPQDHHPCCEETQQLSLDLPLPTPPTHPEEATFPQLNTCTTSAAEI
ncbi:hypothetical protein KUCAC02_003722 [Chaenocephalus aceratus]|uniref:Uncharacterized protein n=1 Tax=Chaenocephalus aceratus TaxID=36190 RepID=A0ACB9WMB8_CHAAC|nr:hypothetical protein KUCAC02_003722 [Chaenocephalus aceratus]